MWEEGDARAEALAAEVSFISVSEAREKNATEGLDLEEQKHLEEDEKELEMVENERYN
jgi:hypothetical protein